MRIFLCKYYIVISDTLKGSLMCFSLLLCFSLFLFAVIFSELHKNPIRKDCVTAKKEHKRVCVRDITFLAAHLSMSFFIAFICLLPRFRLLQFYVRNVFA